MIFGGFSAKIQGMKNAVPKNDKKRRKQLTEDVAKLEAEMEQKHKEELEQLKLNSKESKVCEVMFLFAYSIWKQLSTSDKLFTIWNHKIRGKESHKIMLMYHLLLLFL